MSGSTYNQSGQVVPTQSLAYLLKQLQAQQQAAASAQNQATQTSAGQGSTQTTPQTAQAAGAPSQGAGGGSSPAGAVTAQTTPQMTPAQETQLIQQYLSGTAYPDIQTQIMQAYQREAEGLGSRTGVLGALTDATGGGLGSGGLAQGLGSTGIDAGLSLAGSSIGGPAVAATMALFNLLGGELFTEKPPPLTATDAPWAGGSKGYATGEGGLGPLVSLPNPSASAGGATGQLAQQLGGGLGLAYPWGAGAPYTSGSGIYQLMPQMLPPGAAGSQANPGGNPSFFMPGSTPNTYFDTDYFGNVTGGPYGMQPGVTTAGSTPLGFGAAEPEWLQQAFATTGTQLGWTPGGQSPVGWAAGWGTEPTSQQLSGWGITSTTPDRGGGGGQ